MNPLLTNLDYPDPDVIRVGDTYYMVSTTMHFFPGAEILRSFDLVHWEWVCFVYDVLEDDPAHRLEDGVGIYGKGMWAASLRHHKGIFYVCFVANETQKTYLFRSEHITGPWKRTEVAGFYHDCSLLFDEDRVFLAWGNTEIWITELAPDLSGPLAGGLHRVAVRETGNRVLGYEGSHFYRINGRYYLFLIHSLPFRWRRVQACFWADAIEGEFRGGDVLDDDRGYGTNGVAQGGLVDTPAGDWYAILFQDHGAVGRIPVLLPVTWDGPIPLLGRDGRVVPGLSVPSTRPDHRYRPLVGDGDFRGPLGPQWQWNHNPDPRFWHLVPESGQLKIRTARVATNLLQAQNTLTQRMRFPGCAAEVTVDADALKIGDMAGLAAFQGQYGAVALSRRAEGFEVVMVHAGSDPGTVAARVPSGSRVRLRVEVSFSADRDEATFWFYDKDHWQALGPRHPLVFRLDHFVGCRFALFVLATQTPGGEAGFSEFRYQQDLPQ